MRRSVTGRILEKLDVRAFYSQFTKLSKPSQKGECRGLCPLHEEKTASFWVNVHDGSFKCFGCGKGGGPVQFYAAIKNLSPFEAAAELLRIYGDNGNGRAPARGRKTAPQPMPKCIPPAPPVPTPTHNPAHAAASPVQERSREERQASPTEIYQALLKCGRPLAAQAVDYFAGRGIRLETLDRFQVSFLSDTRAVERCLLDAFGQGALVRAGVLQEKDGKTWFTFSRHPIVFPILKDGLPVFLQGRLLDPKPGAPKYCNVAGPVPALFNRDRLTEVGSGAAVYLCEGAPDTMALEQAGYPAVGVVGCSGFKQEWVDDLKDFAVHLVLDNDDAGHQGTERIREMFHQRNLPVRVVQLPEGIKDVNDFLDGHGTAEFQELVAKAAIHSVDLRTMVEKLLRRVSDPSDRFSYRALGEEIYRWFENNGGVFVLTPAKQAYLMFNRQLVEIGNNDDFNALMMEKTDLVAGQFQARMVWQVIRSHCVLYGRRDADLSWTHASRTGFYINLHNRRNEIACLRNGAVEVVPNGSNRDGVMLRSADKMAPIEFDPTVTPRESVELLRDLALTPLACEPENKLFLVSWILAAFFLDFTFEKPLLKLSGHTGSGKTTAARILSCLLYGADHVESATVAYCYADTARNPFLICDNLETENMNPDVAQFLLHVATGVAKGKRKAGTDSETVRESARALVAITAIEPLTKPELINRTYDVEFRAIFKQRGFMQKEHLTKLLEGRSRILSGLFRIFAAEVLPGLDEKRREILSKLQVLYPNHSKQRVDSFLTFMIVIVSVLLRFFEAGKKDRTWEVVDWWIQYQSRLAEETERDTNLPIYLLDALVKEMMAQGTDFRKQYYLDFQVAKNELGEPMELSFSASGRDLLMALQILGKNKGFKFPFSNAKQLGIRIANDSDVLEKAGWKREHEKTVHGLKHYRLTRKLA